MAEEFGQSKTFAPTERRRAEAREQGHVAHSPDLTNGFQLLAGVAALWFVACAISDGLLDGMRLDLARIHEVGATPEHVQAIFVALLIRAVSVLGLFVGVLTVSGVFVNSLQVGFHVSTEAIAPRWSRVSLVAGWSRLFSRATAFRGLMGVFKVAAVAGVVWWVLRGRVPQLASLGDATLAAALAQGWDIIVRLALAAAAAVVLIGAADYLFQRWRHEQALMMTTQEMKEEMKREEGDPHVKARLRRLAREATKKRMLDDVPKATVVVTNPTHLAIALRYDRGTMAAPRVVAKAAGSLAHRVTDIARRHGVPVLERKPLAQALFKAVRVGQDIPASLYYAVAEVLAYVYRLRRAA
jgi:flagellar biosynthetic protein FlhB